MYSSIFGSTMSTAEPLHASSGRRAVSLAAMVEAGYVEVSERFLAGSDSRRSTESELDDLLAPARRTNPHARCVSHDRLADGRIVEPEQHDCDEPVRRAG